jgi:hypothetical protein
MDKLVDREHLASEVTSCIEAAVQADMVGYVEAAVDAITTAHNVGFCRDTDKLALFATCQEVSGKWVARFDIERIPVAVKRVCLDLDSETVKYLERVRTQLAEVRDGGSPSLGELVEEAVALYRAAREDG